MTTDATVSNRLLAVLILGVLVAATGQALIVVLPSSDSMQFLVIGVGAMSMMILLGVIVWVLRTGGLRE